MPDPWRSRITGHGEADPATLTRNPRNWRTHPRPQLDALAGVLTEVGWVQDVILNRTTGHVVDGHARIDLALSRKEPSVPVVYVDLTPEEEGKVLATLDPIGAMAGADAEALGRLLDGVRTDDAALRATLRDLAEEHGLEYGADGLPGGGEAPEAEVDRAEELRAKWGTAPGQLWVIGRHRLLCGDCRTPEDMRRLCPEPVQGVFTSPPYAEQREAQYGGVPVGEYVDWWEAVQENVRGVLRADGSFFVNIKPHCEGGERVLYVADLVLAMKRRWEWRYVDEFCWLGAAYPGGWDNRFKNGFEPVHQFAPAPRGKFRPENVSRYGVTKEYDGLDGRGVSGLSKRSGGVGHAVMGMIRPSNVIEAKMPVHGGEHAAPFPVALPAFFIQAFSDTDDGWLDPFSGSGTTIAAAEQAGCIGYGIELEPKYVAVTLERLSKMGLEPRLEP